MNQTRGFTIIELVVVIVVIGILAAVALPRFLGLQDKAHDAVVEGTQTALASGVVMAKSLWLTYGQETALNDIDGIDLDANIKGYPIGTSNTATGDGKLNAVGDCVEVFNKLLSTQSVTAKATPSDSDSEEFEAKLCSGTTCSSVDATWTETEACLFTYRPDSTPTVRNIFYDSRTGKVAVSGLVEATFSAGT